MKRLFALLAALCIAALIPTVLAEDTPNPLLRLYQAERTLLFETGNVTMGGHAVFTIDGELFKAADLLHIQNDIDSVRDWQLLTPTEDGDMRSTGYTVVTLYNDVYAYESYQHRQLHWFVDPAFQRTSILGRTVVSDTLADLAELVLMQCGSFGDVSAEAGEDGCTIITADICEQDIPAVIQPLINGLLQYGINRYVGYDYAADTAHNENHYSDFSTVPQGLVACLQSVRLREVNITAVLDAEDRIQDVSCSVTLAYTEKNGAYEGEICVSLEQDAYNYQTSGVDFDPKDYDHWPDVIKPLPFDMAEAEPLIDHAAEDAAAHLLLNSLYCNPHGGAYLHTDANCPSVSDCYLPMEQATVTPELLLQYGLCRVCVELTPFYDESGELSADTACGSLMAALTYDADNGFYSLYAMLVRQLGSFKNWSLTQKHYFSAMLPTLILRENDRMAQYHPGRYSDPSMYEILRGWTHALPADGAESDACKRAADHMLETGLLTQEQLDSLTVTCDYYDSSKYTFPFDEPLWVVRYQNEAQTLYEVWMDAAMTDCHAVSIPDLAAKAMDALLASEPEQAGRRVDPTAMKLYCCAIYLPQEHQWQYVFDTDTDSYWDVYMLDDAELTLVSVMPNNG